jgi:hypothetical protein
MCHTMYEFIIIITTNEYIFKNMKKVMITGTGKLRATSKVMQHQILFS